MYKPNVGFCCTFYMHCAMIHVSLALPLTVPFYTFCKLCCALQQDKYAPCVVVAHNMAPSAVWLWRNCKHWNKETSLQPARLIAWKDVSTKHMEAQVFGSVSGECNNKSTSIICRFWDGLQENLQTLRCRMFPSFQISYNMLPWKQ